MKKKRAIIISTILICVILLAVASKYESGSNIENSDVIFDSVSYVDNTTNLFSILGNKLSNIFNRIIGYIFIVINKLLGFIFGI